MSNVVSIHPDAVASLAETTAVRQSLAEKQLSRIEDTCDRIEAKVDALARAVDSTQARLQGVIYSQLLWPTAKAIAWLVVGGAAATTVLHLF